MGTALIRVGYDLTTIWRRSTGIFRYATELAKHLLLLEKSAPSIQYVLFFAKEIHPDFLPLQDTFEAIICPTTSELFIKQCWFPAIIPRLKLDAIHYPSFPPPYFQCADTPEIMTLHDAGPWRYPHTLTLHGRVYFRTLLTRGIQHCTRIITVSEHARSEIKHFLGEHHLSKIAVIPEAARPECAIACTDMFKQEVRERYQLPARYLLTVSTVEPRKNLKTLLHAYQLLKKQLRSACPLLFIVGRRGWNHNDILSHMAELKYHVYFPGHVADAELIALYQMATCLVFPSLYEGFGLPVLEAMSAGCPVITSNTSSLPEVAGNAGLLVDPLNPADIARAIYTLLDNDALRLRLIQDGHQQAARFSWEATASMARDLYLQVCEQKQTNSPKLS
ncbi:glycosyl transferase family 1 [Reticulibacter mediterranei]|uniref:Glycosyl transferase family 1 n=1 Tax=Reticulibacter mediterranei TaxID=2778369 RepID=A0A8J3N221_9CHLR|nr:glycosyltransferase family 1 protein [Reticulibacter mediterranei]GHO91862.1 glycosyl transferase family 1 [Reticulibacter mediterranei]